MQLQILSFESFVVLRREGWGIYRLVFSLAIASVVTVPRGSGGWEDGAPRRYVYMGGL